MKEVYKNSWGQAALEHDFAGLAASLLAAADEAAQRQIIAAHPIALSYAFSTYCIDLRDTIKEAYNAATKAASGRRGQLSADEKTAMKRMQRDLKQMKAISAAINAVSFEDYRRRNPPQDAPAPTPADPVLPPAPATTRDPRLVGCWEYSTFTSSGGFSVSSVRTRVLRQDGRFVEAGQSAASMTHRDLTGRETGRTSADSGVSPEERGTWRTQGAVLRLDWDSGYYATYSFELGSEGVLLTPIAPAGDARYWARIA